ncbi:MAG: hypothetical protein WBB08_08885 [Halobacteriota archaeon]
MTTESSLINRRSNQDRICPFKSPIYFFHSIVMNTTSFFDAVVQCRQKLSFLPRTEMYRVSAFHFASAYRNASLIIQSVAPLYRKRPIYYD